MTHEDPVQNVSFASGGGTAHGFLVTPESGSGPGVVVIQEWWGLTTHIADIANRLAAEGFVALAPDLYGGRTTHDAAEAEQLLDQLPVDRATQDLAGAVDYLLSLEAVTSSTVGAVGFCMGGGFVLGLAADQGDRVSAAVPFYGMPRDPAAVANITASVQGHYGRDDGGIPVETVTELFDQLRARGNSAEEFVYPAGHAFLNDEDLIGTYDPEQAAIAWGRAVDFLREHVK